MKTYPPFTPPKGMTFDQLLQLAPTESLSTLRESHSLIDQAEQGRLLQTLQMLSMTFPDSDKPEDLRQAFYQQFYDEDYLSRLISFIPAEVNQLFIRQPFIHQSTVHPDDWLAVSGALNAFSSVGVFDQIEDEKDPGFSCKPAYIEALLRQAKNENFRSINEWNILAIDAINALMAIFGILPLSQLANYLRKLGFDFFSTDDEWYLFAQKAPGLICNFFVDQGNFVMKKYMTKQRQDILIKSQAQYDPYPITDLDQLFSLTNNFYQSIPISPLANYLVQLSFKHQLSLPRGFAVHLIMDVCENLVPRTELFIQFFKQWVELNEEECQQIHQHFLELIRQKHIPELNGHSTLTIEEWLKTHEVHRP